MIRFSAAAALVLALVALPAVAFGKFIRVSDYESIQLGGATKSERPSMLPGGSVRIVLAPPTVDSAPVVVDSAPVVAPAPPAVVLAQPVAAITRTPAQRRVPKTRHHGGESHARSRIANSTPAPGGSPAVAPAPPVTPAAIDGKGSSGPSLALLIAAIAGLGAVAVLILRVRPEWFGGLPAG